MGRDRVCEIAGLFFVVFPPVRGRLRNGKGLYPVGRGDLDVELRHAFVSCEADHAQHTRHFQAREHAIERPKDLVERKARLGELLILLVAFEHRIDASACRDEEPLDLLAVSREGVHVDLAELATPDEEPSGERAEPRAVSPLSLVPRVGLQLTVDEGAHVHEERLVRPHHFAQVGGGDGGHPRGPLPRLAHLDDAPYRALDAECAAGQVLATTLERAAFVVHGQQPPQVLAREPRVRGFAERIEECEVGRERPGHLVLSSVQVVHEVFGQFVGHLVERCRLSVLGGLYEDHASKGAEHALFKELDVEDLLAIFTHLLHPDHVAWYVVPFFLFRILALGLHYRDLRGADELEDDGQAVQEEVPAVAGEAGLHGEHGLDEPEGTDHGDLWEGECSGVIALLAPPGYLP